MKHEPSLGTGASEIVLRLDKYDDIYSDFDMRPYSSRALSVDFIEELKRASRDKEDVGIELTLHSPGQERDEATENTIRERLTAHFKKHYLLVLKERNRVMRLGIIMVTLGVICMVAATLIVFEDPTHNAFLSFLVVFLEPAAWFLLWEGMDQIIFNSKNIAPELDFYRKMAHHKGRVHFQPY